MPHREHAKSAVNCRLSWTEQSQWSKISCWQKPGYLPSMLPLRSHHHQPCWSKPARGRWHHRQHGSNRSWHAKPRRNWRNTSLAAPFSTSATRYTNLSKEPKFGTPKINGFQNLAKKKRLLEEPLSLPHSLCTNNTKHRSAFLHCRNGFKICTTFLVGWLVGWLVGSIWIN